MVVLYSIGPDAAFGTSNSFEVEGTFCMQIEHLSLVPTYDLLLMQEMAKLI